MDIFLYTFGFCTFITPLLFPQVIWQAHLFLWFAIPTAVLHVCKQTEWYEARQKAKHQDGAAKRAKEADTQLAASIALEAHKLHKEDEALKQEWDTTDYRIPTNEQFRAELLKDNSSLTRIFMSQNIQLNRWSGSHGYKHYPVAEVKTLYARALVEAKAASLIIPEATRFAGTWIIAPSGRGKTTLLHHMIAEDRKSGGTVVLMDSKSEFYNSYSGLPDVVIIDPATVQINPFQIASATLTTEFLEYIFSALLETEMTPFQSTLFSAVLALVIRIPNATIETFREILLSGWKPYEKYVQRLDPIDRDFFTAPNPEFDQKSYKERRNELIWRLRLLLRNPYLRRIFTSPKSNIDFYELLDSGKTIIIDNAVAQLGITGAEFFGRFFVAIIWMAAISRSSQKPEQKVPVYFYIDEAQTVISRDEKIPVILDECRSQKIALILSHQRITRIASANVMDALTNCAIKIGNADDDAAALAKRFRVEPAALDLPQGVFCLYVRDTTPTAVTLSKLPLFDLSTFPPPLPRTAPPRNDEAPAQEEPEPPNTDPPKDHEYDHRYDILDSLSVNPSKARVGFVLTVTLPNKRTHQENIPPGTQNGYRFVVRGASTIRRPDNRNGNYWVELEIAAMPGASTKEDL